MREEPRPLTCTLMGSGTMLSSPNRLGFAKGTSVVSWRSSTSKLPGFLSAASGDPGAVGLGVHRPESHARPPWRDEKAQGQLHLSRTGTNCLRFILKGQLAECVRGQPQAPQGPRHQTLSQLPPAAPSANKALKQG